MAGLRFLPYFLRQAWVSLREGRGAPLVAIVTIAISLFLLGSFLVVLSNLSRHIASLGEQVQVVVYLKEEVGALESQTLREEMRGRPEVAAVRFISKAEALKLFRSRLGGRGSILDGLNPNPLPASFVLTLKPEHRTARHAGELAERLQGLSGVEGVDYGRAQVEAFESLGRAVKWAVVTVGTLLGIGIVFIVSNTIRLSLLSREEEIEIMKLVGATPWFIRSPFLLQGCLQGLMGGLLALGALYLLYRGVLLRWGEIYPGLGVGPVEFLSIDLCAGLLALGAILGVVGSLMPTGRLLRDIS